MEKENGRTRRQVARQATLLLISIGLAATFVLAGPPPKSTKTSETTATEDPQPQDPQPHGPRSEDQQANDPRAGVLPDGPSEADYPHLHNLLRVSHRIYSGGEPKDELAFAELARLGIKTVVSVDGARPQIELATRHGLQYVHIPIGYDGVPESAGLQLASLVRQAAGSIYIHCHHGKHRGPAAAAVACIADGSADGETALRILRQAGTSAGYGGLWRDVQSYRVPPADAKLPALVATAEVGSLAAAMAQIDRASDNLKLCQDNQWESPADHPDLAAAQQALLLMEGFRETVRQLDADNPYDARFLDEMRDSERSARRLHDALTSHDKALAQSEMQTVQQQCKQCHQAYRD